MSEECRWGRGMQPRIVGRWFVVVDIFELETKFDVFLSLYLCLSLFMCLFTCLFTCTIVRVAVLCLYEAFSAFLYTFVAFLYFCSLLYNFVTSFTKKWAVACCTAAGDYYY